MTTLHLSLSENHIIKIIAHHGPCNSEEVNSHIDGGDLLTTMRTIHALEKKGMVIRVAMGTRKLFQVRPHLKSIVKFTSAESHPTSQEQD